MIARMCAKSMDNYNDIMRKKVKIGDRVFIRRSNDVIPEILAVAETYPHSRIIEKPKNLGNTKRTGSTIHFKPDPKIFSTTLYNYDTIKERLRETAFLSYLFPAI